MHCTSNTPPIFKFKCIKSIIYLVFLSLFLVSSGHAAGLGISESLLSRIGQEYGLAARNRIADWQQLVASNQHTSSFKNLKRVNHFFNRVRFISDKKNWGQQDYWATPIEMLAKNGADCEDFSIAKYITLRKLGIAEANLRIAYVKTPSRKESHMVLFFFSGSNIDPLVLDNLTDEIKPLSQRSDLIPVYSFNAAHLWVASNNNPGQRLVGNGPPRQWREMNARLNLRRL